MAYQFLQGVDTPKDQYSGAVPTLTLEHSEVHAGRGFAASLNLSVANGAVGAVQMSVPVAAAATVTVTMTGANSNMTYTANTKGNGGNSISVVHVDPAANNRPLAVTRVGNAITVSLKTGAGGAIESTATQVAAAVNADESISRVLTATVEGTGAGVVEAKSVESLAGGKDTLTLHFKAASVSVTKGTMTAIFKEDASFAAAGTAVVPINRNRLSSNLSQITMKSNNATTVVNGAARVDLFTTILGAASPGNQRISGETGQGEELLLARGKNYLFEVTNSSGTEENQSFTLEWYERAQDVFRGFV